MGTTFEQPSTCPQHKAFTKTCSLRFPRNVHACPEAFSVSKLLLQKKKSDLSPEVPCAYYYY
jgi:hypothetical protein